MDLDLRDTPETNPRTLALARGAAALGIALSHQQLARLLGFLDLLARWNRRFNLTAIRDPMAMVSHHVLDSLAVAPYLQGESILDLGTGAGLPGLPLAIAEPSRRFWLLDSNGRKVRFVRQAVLDLGLTNVEPVQSRIESYRPGRKFSTIVTRAVASTPELHAQTVPLLASPGLLLVMKGRYPGEELAHPALAALDLAIRSLNVPLLDGERHLIEIRRD
jgi:16S rRNA (guanine527-N7)-methyltransferase